MLTYQNPLLRELAARGEDLSFDTNGLLFNAAVDAQAMAIVKIRDKRHLSSVVRTAAENGTPMSGQKGATTACSPKRSSDLIETWPTYSSLPLTILRRRFRQWWFMIFTEWPRIPIQWQRPLLFERRILLSRLFPRGMERRTNRRQVTLLGQTPYLHLWEPSLSPAAIRTSFPHRKVNGRGSFSEALRSA